MPEYTQEKSPPPASVPVATQAETQGGGKNDVANDAGRVTSWKAVTLPTELRPQRRGNRLLTPRPCAVCANIFYARNDGASRFCSMKCVAVGRRKPETIATNGDRKAKVRANGLINMRVRRGAMGKPELCEWCKENPCKDFHHPDYDRPDYGWWLCRSCHTNIHLGKIVLPEKRVA